MTAVGREVDVYQRYLDELIDARLLIPSGVRGVYGLGGAFERVIEHFEKYITRMGQDARPEVMRFPPVLSRATYEKTDHLETFPNLMGSVHTFTGDERQALKLAAIHSAGSDWTGGLESAGLMLTPAACYPLYPSATGTLPEGGRLVDLRSFVFRHEPSDDPARMQIFRQREYVRLGNSEEALVHRDSWLKRGNEMLHAVGLESRPVVANDPFFGRGGRAMAATQREQNLKYELIVPIASMEKPTAVVSCNYHLDHFGRAFAIRTAAGEVAHTSCIGFGLERIALALFKKHGLSSDLWPCEVRNTLDL